MKDQLAEWVAYELERGRWFDLVLVELARSDSVGGLVEDVLREGLGEDLGGDGMAACACAISSGVRSSSPCFPPSAS